MAFRKIKKILLVNPPGTLFVQPDGSRQVKECPAPLGLAYLVAQLVKSGDYDVRVYDMVVENFDQEVQLSADTVLFGATFADYRKVLESYRPDMVGLSCILSNRSKSVMELSRIAKQVDPAIVVVAGGHHATAMPDHLLNNGVDYVVLGEADYSFPRLIQTLNAQGDLAGVDGIAYRVDSSMTLQPRKDFVKNVDELPRPGWDVVGLKKYWGLLPMGIPLTHDQYGVMNTSRGCPHICSYCAVPKHTGERNFRARSLDNVIQELGWLVETYGIKEMQFMDDNFFVNKNRLKELCRLLIANFPDLAFAVPTGTDIANIDLELIDLLRRANFRYMSVGIETGDMNVQGKFVDKKINMDETRAKIQRMKEVGIQLSGFFMLGFPGETREQIQKTVELSTSLDLDRIYLIMMTPLPGSQMYDHCVKNNLLYEDFDITKLRYSNTFIKNEHISRAELEGIRKNVWKEYMSKRMDISEYGKSKPVKPSIPETVRTIVQ